jgi:hypothetical protein
MSYVGQRRRYVPRYRRGSSITLTVLAVLTVVALSALGLVPWPKAIVDRASAGSTQAPREGGDTRGGDATLQTPGAASDNAAAAAAPGGLPSTTFGRWQYPNALGPVLGTAGSLLRYRVAVQQTLPVTVAEFTDAVDSTLGDARSWIAGRDVRLQRVPPASAHDFTIYLATPATADELCSQGGLDIRENGVPYTSCRTGDLVVINADRYLNAVPDYGAPLVEYRHYMINHEVGHRLGHGHELCPAAGRPAPVMEQQTLGLQGCVANSWPYVEGRRYSGAPTA